MANTDKYYSMPADLAGISLTTPSTAFAFSRSAIVDSSVGVDINITGLTFNMTVSNPASDTTLEILFEIGRGVTFTPLIQIPASYRMDTIVGFCAFVKEVFIPEPVFVPQGTMLSVRVAAGVGSAQTYSGIKIKYQAIKNISVPTSSLNNYSRFKVGNGLSTSIGGVM